MSIIQLINRIIAITFQKKLTINNINCKNTNKTNNNRPIISKHIYYPKKLQRKIKSINKKIIYIKISFSIILSNI